ncbi:hypothetical protein KIPB_002511 [Kipferlia bialata]|uniref:J domain-containing protein n=1 Tax=Kipferlia bialata TaxID=797122 RepID=A0A391NMF5_9EUKA|nr:hypothetical protein KIPB_002511 [Kipferlia bialata]|eukprot:g2511.t1
MSTDPLKLLGVDANATPKEITKAYRRRALKCHPDRHPDDPEAASKFHELTQAYELLLDPQRLEAWRQNQAAAKKVKERDATRRKAAVEMQERINKKEGLQQQKRREKEAERVRFEAQVAEGAIDESLFYKAKPKKTKAKGKAGQGMAVARVSWEGGEYSDEELMDVMWLFGDVKGVTRPDKSRKVVSVVYGDRECVREAVYASGMAGRPGSELTIQKRSMNKGKRHKAR